MNREQRKYLKDRIEKIYNDRLTAFRGKLKKERESLPTAYATFAEKLVSSSKVQKEFLKAVVEYLKSDYSSSCNMLHIHINSPLLERISTARSEARDKMEEKCLREEAEFTKKESARKTQVLDKIMLGSDYDELMKLLTDYENGK